MLMWDENCEKKELHIKSLEQTSITIIIIDIIIKISEKIQPLIRYLDEVMDGRLFYPYR